MLMKTLKTRRAAVGAVALVLVLIATAMPIAHGALPLPPVVGNAPQPEPLVLLGAALIALGSFVRGSGRNGRSARS